MATTEHCGNCANLGLTFSMVHNVCLHPDAYSHGEMMGQAKVGRQNLKPGPWCVCDNVADSTKPANCPGWVATKTTEATR